MVTLLCKVVKSVLIFDINLFILLFICFLVFLPTVVNNDVRSLYANEQIIYMYEVQIICK